jgi:hypothetical protein
MGIQSGLLAAVNAQMLSFFKTDSSFKNRPNTTTEKIILIFTYISIIASVSATISSLILTDEFAEMPVRAARDPTIQMQPIREEFAGKDWQLLGKYGLRGSINLVIYHCACSGTFANINLGY